MTSHDIHQELLKSSRLKSYFDENPVESDLLHKVRGVEGLFGVCVVRGLRFLILSLRVQAAAIQSGPGNL